MLGLVILVVLGFVLTLAWHNVHLSQFRKPRHAIQALRNQEWVWYHRNPGIVKLLSASSKQAEQILYFENVGTYRLKSPDLSPTLVSSYTIEYKNYTLPLSSLKSLALTSAQHPAFSHSMLCATFRLPSSHQKKTLTICFSFHQRRLETDRYDPVRALFRHYEMHHIMFEFDSCVFFRKFAEGEQIFVFPLLVDEKTQKSILLNLVQEEFSAEKAPKFYHTMTNNCGKPLLEAILKAIGKEDTINRAWVLFWGLDAVLSKMGILPKDVLTNRGRYNISSRIHATEKGIESIE